MIFWFLGFLFLFLVLGIPVALALGLTMLSIMLAQTNLPLFLIPQQLTIGADNYALMAIPFFMLAGEFMTAGGITRRLVDFVIALIGWVRGGLALVNVGSSMLMAGLSGSSVADASLQGSMLIPAMKEKGYSSQFSAAVTAVSSTIGVIIPPSIPMIVLGIVTGIDVVMLFLGGVIPGLLIGAALLVVAWVMSVLRGYPAEAWTGMGEVVRTVGRTFWALLLPVIILGGILGGVFTVVEASVVAVVYAFVIARFVYRDMSWRECYRCFIRAAILSGVVMFIVATASGTAWILTSERVPHELAGMLAGLTADPLVFLILSMAFLLLVGAVMDLTPALLLLGPILLPVAVSYGIDPIHFGVLMVINLAIGLVTPPVGSCLYLCAGIARTPVERVIYVLLPFLLAEVAVLLLVVLVPGTVLWIPSLF